MICIPLIASCLMTWSLASMDNIEQKVDLITDLPRELIYKIIEQWPALNVYRLINKQWHALTSYEHANEIIGNINLGAIGSWDLQKLVLEYILKNDVQRLLTVLSDKKRIFFLQCTPDIINLPENVKTVLKKHIHTFSDTENHELYNAACCGNYNKMLSEFSAKPAHLKAVSQFGYTSLEGAVAYDRLEIMHFLCLLGSPRNNTHRSIFHIAAECAHINTVSQILTRDLGMINYQNSNSITPFMLALAGGRLHIAKLFIQRGATINVYNTQYGLPLYDACKKGYGEIVEFLLSHTIDVEQGLITEHSQHLSPLWIAATNNHIEIAEKLIRAGAKIDRGPEETSGMPTSTPLIQAAYMGHAHMVQLLLDAGADTSLKFNGKTARETALQRKHSHVVTILQNHPQKIPSDTV